MMRALKTWRRPIGPTPWTAIDGARAEAFAVHRVEGLRLVEIVGDGHQLGHHGEARVDAVGHLVDEGVGADVDVLGPAAHQMRRVGRGEVVAVAADVLAEGKAGEVAAIVAAAAEDIRAHHDAVADVQLLAVIFEAGARLAADLGDGADDLVAGDDRERRRGLRRRAAILRRLAAIGVLVGAADAAHLERDDHRVVADLRIGEILGLDPARRDHDGRLHTVRAH